MLRLTTTLLIICCSTLLFGQTKWTKPEHLADSLRAAPKPVVVFIHTSWCKYCRMQEKTTFQDKKVSSILAKDFYLVGLDAESKEDINFLGRTYKGQGDAHYHALAEYLGVINGKIAFPTTVLMSPQLKIYDRHSGYLSRKQMPGWLESASRRD